ncbi:MAG TPA: HD domain-containing protein [Nanoarchaeota archaeon]|nr:HD domain-containing protein [Nanoarchaeota archaeon]
MKPYLISKGRRYEEKEDTLIADPFLNDYTKIIQSKAYRRLAFKTQVVSLPDNPHMRTRLVHTEEVVSIALAIATQLGLNPYLCMAIAAVHDIGHTPFGHIGEQTLTKIGGKPFRHEVNSVVIAQHIERKGKGLNLSYETLEGGINHSRGSGELSIDPGLPQEYNAVLFADKIAYTVSDPDDAVRYGYIDRETVLEKTKKLGRNQRKRVNNLVSALVEESKRKGFVSFSEGEMFEEFEKARQFMYKDVYAHIDTSLQEQIIHGICDYFAGSDYFGGVEPVFLTSLLTDKEAVSFGSYMLKCRRPKIEEIAHFGIFEILPYIKGGEIDYTNPDLDWGKNSLDAIAR